MYRRPGLTAKNARVVLYLLLLAGSLSVLPLNQKHGLAHTNSHASVFAPRDMLCFWSAAKLLRLGGNPYELDQLGRMTRAAYPMVQEVVPYVGPPWLLTMLLPLSLFDLTTARILWLIINCIAMWLIVRMSLRLAVVAPSEKARAFCLSFLFLPAIYAIFVEQISLVLCLFLLAALSALTARRDWRAGVLLVPLATKPHLFLPLGCLFAVWLLHTRRWKPAAAFCAGAALVLALTLALNEHSITNWMNQEFSGAGYRSSSLATPLRLLAAHFQSTLPRWPLAAVPLTGMVAALLWGWRPAAAGQWRQILPVGLILSVGFAPYAWFYDYALLLPLNTLLTAKAAAGRDGHRHEARIWLLLLTGAALVTAYRSPELAALLWFPWLFFVIWLRCQGEPQNWNRDIDR